MKTNTFLAIIWNGLLMCCLVLFLMVRASLELLPTSGIEIYEAEFSPFFHRRVKRTSRRIKRNTRRCNIRTFPSSLLTVFAREFAHVSSFCMEEEQSRLDFWEEGTKCRTQDNDDDFSHSLAYSDEKELRSLLFYCFLLFQVNSQRTGEK